MEIWRLSSARLRNPIIPSVLLFILGLFCGAYRPLCFPLIITLLSLLILFLVWSYRKSCLRLCLTLLLFGFFCLGFFSSSLEEYPSPKDHLKYLVKQEPDMFQNDGIDLSGTITASIESSPRGNSLLLSEVCFQSNQGPLHTKGKMRLFIPHPIEGERIFFRPGDRLETFAKLKIPRNFANPGAFDYAS